jgi:hypothetical protein
MRLERGHRRSEKSEEEEGWSKKDHLCFFLLNEEAQHDLVCSAEESMW